MAASPCGGQTGGRAWAPQWAPRWVPRWASMLRRLQDQKRLCQGAGGYAPAGVCVHSDRRLCLVVLWPVCLCLQDASDCCRRPTCCPSAAERRLLSSLQKDRSNVHQGAWMYEGSNSRRPECCRQNRRQHCLTVPAMHDAPAETTCTLPPQQSAPEGGAAVGSSLSPSVGAAVGASVAAAVGAAVGVVELELQEERHGRVSAGEL